MSGVITVRTPAQIASEINTLKSRTDKIMLKNCVQIGRCLTEAKAVLAYGEWGNWLKESVSYSQRTAEHLMRIYREFGPKLASGGEGLQDSNPDSNLGFSQAVILLGIPAEEREDFMACYDVANMTKRELQEAVKENKPVLSQAEQLIPVTTKVRRRRTVPSKRGQLTAAANPDSEKYSAQYISHRETLLNTFGEMKRILVMLDRIDPVVKEINREATVKMLITMAESIKVYPPEIITNLDLRAGNDG